MQAFIQTLRQALQQKLPGTEAQYRLAHPVRRIPLRAPAEARRAGVLVLFFPKNDQWHLVFIERASRNTQDRHAGQISFPGGQYETDDGNLTATALREAEEEIAAPRQDIEVLGQLSQLYIPVSNFVVQPVVGLLQSAPAFRPQESEVRAILEVPFSYFQDAARLRQMDMRISSEMLLRDVPFYDLDGKVLWGATAMMMSELLAVLES